MFLHFSIFFFLFNYFCPYERTVKICLLKWSTYVYFFFFICLIALIYLLSSRVAKYLLISIKFSSISYRSDWRRISRKVDKKRDARFLAFFLSVFLNLLFLRFCFFFCIVSTRSMCFTHALQKITENDKCIALRLSWVIINFFFMNTYTYNVIIS